MGLPFVLRVEASAHTLEPQPSFQLRFPGQLWMLPSLESLAMMPDPMRQDTFSLVGYLCRGLLCVASSCRVGRYRAVNLGNLLIRVLLYLCHGSALGS